MATQNPTLLGGLKAGIDLRTKQYHAVKMSAADTVVACTGVTDKPIGILQNNPNLNEEASIAVGGTSKFVAGGVVTNGTNVGTKADGRAQTAVATQFPVGTVVGDTTANDGEVTTVAVRIATVPLP
ncbi:MAG: hypothetical protein ABL886_13850 [Rhodoglobus sp.]